MTNDTLTELLQQLDAPAARYAQLNRYYAGEGPLTFLAPEIRASLNNRLSRVAVNIPRLLVDTIAERLRITGFTGADVGPDWLRNDLDQMAGVAHREALTLGRCPVIVWANDSGAPQVTVESATQVTCRRDPATRQIVAAVKRWETESTSEAVLFEPDQITRYTSKNKGATIHGFETAEKFTNPFGTVPVVELVNGGRLLTTGESEMGDVLSLTDALTKLTTDLLVASEYAARPRRTAVGLELVEDEEGNAVNPFDESDRMLISESPDTKFGQLPGSDLAGYENAIGVLMRQVSAVSGLPEHSLGIGGDNPTSADSIRASEAALTAKAEARQQSFGKSWEQVARLMAATRSGADPNRVEVSITWADAATRSVAQEADAVVKLHAAGILPTSYALSKLGYSADDITQIEAARRADLNTTKEIA